MYFAKCYWLLKIKSSSINQSLYITFLERVIGILICCCMFSSYLWLIYEFWFICQNNLVKITIYLVGCWIAWFGFPFSILGKVYQFTSWFRNSALHQLLKHLCDIVKFQGMAVKYININFNFTGFGIPRIF